MAEGKRFDWNTLGRSHQIIVQIKNNSDDVLNFNLFDRSNLRLPEFVEVKFIHSGTIEDVIFALAGNRYLIGKLRLDLLEIADPEFQLDLHLTAIRRDIFGNVDAAFVHPKNYKCTIEGKGGINRCDMAFPEARKFYIGMDSTIILPIQSKALIELTFETSPVFAPENILNTENK